ncbi:NAD(P)/FAD-dependent oxidoreductase [Anaerotalea alkaliphila]|uniref:NAD(P)/FAD-dependent oxidoreductase n=1 Tax=Anaerotalea alkaliphila TaxID=2662126 RepID=A0A7X5HXF7_9FIRM|nr:NAD(P)/FAD-dependent oxidoreductase [Anaerotalea alkaliphila]NDL68422.1 NAD(P)/FAD-dependent oxidoreductase [Anaerotalea alkaliphila]
MPNPIHANLQKVRDGKRTFAITPRIPGGFLTPDTMVKIAEVARKYKGTLKITSGQRVIILGIKAEDVAPAWTDLGMDPGVLSSYSVKNIEMCPASFCKRMKQNSLKVGMRLEKRYYGRPAPNRVKIAVVGCLNACSSAHGKDIAVLADAEGYIVRVGGSAGYHPRLPDEIASGLTEEEVLRMVDAVFDYYSDTAEMGEKLGLFIDRIGLETFKQNVKEYYGKGKE